MARAAFVLTGSLILGLGFKNVFGHVWLNKYGTPTEGLRVPAVSAQAQLTAETGC